MKMESVVLAYGKKRKKILTGISEKKNWTTSVIGQKNKQPQTMTVL
ncbi:hypothetical protein NUZ5A_20250 [Candidatus Nitrosotenuis uzonensis]|uniref:Uncharacterized protein n=1 Tax=Candidatus Nitrosotenuis uzonensis TaxID=1407055 RepID=A0A812EZG0_9ARCH|nr:hypothetical protein NUZ5A_20250 [Candidatus Nitrosotenuis uzonensis]